VPTQNQEAHAWLAQDILTDGVAQNIAYYLNQIGFVPTGGVSGPVIDAGGQVNNVRSTVYAGGAKGNGVTNDTVAVQAAITALGATGGTVLLPPGVYPLATLTPVSNMIFRGSGKGNTVIKCPAGNNTLFNTGTYNLTDIELCDFTYDGTLGTGGAVGIEFVLASRIAIRRCRVINTNGVGVEIFQSADCLVEENDVESSGYLQSGTNAGQQAGIVINTGSTSLRHRIVNNRVYNANDSGIFCSNAVTDCIIAGNVVDTSFYIGIATGAGGLRNTIHGNTVHNSTNDGIDIGTSTGCTITSNIVDGCLYGFSNDMSTSPAGTFAGNTWLANTVTGASVGFFLGSVNGCTGFSIVGNTVDTASQHGMIIGVFSHGVIEGNIVHNSPDGVDFNGTASHNVVKGNTFFDDRGGSSVMTAINYVAATGVGNLIEGNDFSLVHTFITGTPAVSDIYRGNIGYNPVGVVSPGVPASGSPVVAVGYDRTFYVTTVAGTTSLTMAIQGGPTVTAIASTAQVLNVRVPGGQTMTPTYTGTAPTWVVEGE
jgi:parallel beta-helix repeat protein